MRDAEIRNKDNAGTKMVSRSNFIRSTIVVLLVDVK